MKKMYLIIMMMVLGFSLFGLDHGLITGFEVGYNISKINRMNDSDSDFVLFDESSESLDINMMIGYRIEGLRILGTYTNTLKPIQLDSYRPIQDRFRIDINYTFKDFKIGFYHWCDHPVTPDTDTRYIFNNMAQRAVYLSYYKEF